MLATFKRLAVKRVHPTRFIWLRRRKRPSAGYLSLDQHDVHVGFAQRMTSNCIAVNFYSVTNILSRVALLHAPVHHIRHTSQFRGGKRILFYQTAARQHVITLLSQHLFYRSRVGRKRRWRLARASDERDER